MFLLLVFVLILYFMLFQIQHHTIQKASESIQGHGLVVALCLVHKQPDGCRFQLGPKTAGAEAADGFTIPKTWLLQMSNKDSCFQ